MTLQSTTSTAALGTTDSFHYVDWGAIIAGAVLASAISLLLFTFGGAIGLSMLSPWDGEGANMSVYFIVMGLWTLWVVVSSFMAGGYMAGRMRRRIGDGTEHEVEVRDGAHGLLVWALGLLLASLLLALGISGAAGVAAKGAGAAAGVAGVAAARGDVNDYTIDSLLRPTGTSTAASNAATAAPAAGAADATAATTDAMGANPPMGDATQGASRRASQSDRQEISRLMTFGTVHGALTADNKTYLAQRVAAQTGLTQAEAQARIDQVLTEAKKKADTARKIGIVIGFLTAAALAVAAAAAAWAANLGGRHRDQGTDMAAFWRWH